jgi:hypothetical protein
MKKSAGFSTLVLAAAVAGVAVVVTFLGNSVYKSFTGNSVLGEKISTMPPVTDSTMDGVRVYPKKVPVGETTPIVVEGKLIKGFIPNKLTIRLASQDAAVAEFPSGVKAVPTVTLVDEAGSKFPASIKCLDFVGRKVVDDVYIKDEQVEFDNTRPELKEFKLSAMDKPKVPAKDEGIGKIPNTGLLKPGVTPKTNVEEDLKRTFSTKPGLKPYSSFQCDVVYPKVPVATDKVEVMVRNLGALCEKTAGCGDVNVELVGSKTGSETGATPVVKKYITKTMFTR